MAEQQKQSTNDFVTSNLFPVLATEPSPQREKEIQMLNATTECLQWKKKFEESKATIAALQNKNLKIMEEKGVLKGKINSARYLMQGYLNSPLTSETAGQLENILRVLQPDQDEFTSKGHCAQQTLTEDTTEDPISSVEAGSSLGVSNTGAQNYLDTPVTGNKRRQVSVGNDRSQKKALRVERPDNSSTSKTTCSQTQKHSKKSSIRRTPLTTGEYSTGNTNPPQIQAHDSSSQTFGVSNPGAQSFLDIPVTQPKRCQISGSGGNEVSHKKVRPNERLGSSASKKTQQCQAQKHSKKSSVRNTHSTILEPSTGPPQIEIENAPSSPTSRLQSTMNTQNMEESLSPSAAEQPKTPPRDIITRGTILRASAQSETLHLAMNGNEDLDEDSDITPLQVAVESFTKSLLKNKNLDDETKNIIEKLCVLLKLDTVALKLAVSCINEDFLVLADPLKVIIENYYARIRNDLIRSVCENPCYLTWRVTSEKIKKTPRIGEEALKVMEIISFLASDNIPTQFVLDLYNSMENEDHGTIGENIFQLLKRFSVINSSSGKSISVHPVLQEAIRNDLEEKEKFSEILGRIQRGSHEMIKKIDISSEQKIHILSLWDHVKNRSDVFEEDHAYPISFCRVSIQLGKFRNAYNYSCRVLPHLESSTIYGKQNRWTLALMYWKGTALERLGEYSEALDLLREVYKKQKELFGDEDDDCLETANEIGVVHFQLGKNEEALEWFRYALEKRERIFGKNHQETLSLKTNIAEVLKEQGYYQEVMKLCQQVLKVQERERGRENPSTLTTKFNMATVRFLQWRYKDALKLFQEVLEVRERVLKVDHPDTLTTKDWIADTYSYRHLGRIEEAIELYKEVLEKREKVLGPEHPDTLSTKNDLAVCRFQQGKYKHALKMLQEVLEVRERDLGEYHPDTLVTRSWIHDTFKRLGRTRNGGEVCGKERE